VGQKGAIVANGTAVEQAEFFRLISQLGFMKPLGDPLLISPCPQGEKLWNRFLQH